MSSLSMRYVTLAALTIATLFIQGCALKIRGIQTASGVVVDTYCLSHLTDTPFAGGSGTALDPYLICTPQQLDQIRNFLNSSFKLRSDLDLTAFTTGMFGNVAAFSGSFDGNGFTIRNLTLNPGANYVGLFSSVDGTITRLKVENASITGASYVAIAIGELKAAGKILDSFVSGNVNVSFNHGGGLVGTNFGTIKHSGANVLVNNTAGGNQAYGGLVGHNYFNVFESYALGNVVGVGSDSGGLVGINDGTISDSFARGNASDGGTRAGGLVSANGPLGVISNCYSTGVPASAGIIGGLVASSTGTVSNSFWDTQTSGTGVSAAGTGQTTANMQIQGTFAGWDFATPIWRFNSAVSIYPVLQLAP